MNDTDTPRVRWEVGTDVLVRIVGSANGKIWGHPHKVVCDDGEAVLLYMPEGTPIFRAQLGHGSPVALPPYTSQMQVLKVMNFRLRYSTWLVWAGKLGTAPHWPWFEGPGRFRGWKVDIHSLPVRHGAGIDLTDDSIDLIVQADGTRIWKDEAHLKKLITDGVYSSADAVKIRDVCVDAENAVIQKAFPFDDSLLNWMPDTSLAPPRDPANWMDYGDPSLNLSTGRRYDVRST